MALPSKQLTLRTLGDQSFQRMTALIYGEAKSGKTSLVRTVLPLLRKTPTGTPDLARVLFVIADPGTASISDLSGIKTFTLFKDGTPLQLLDYLKAGADKEFDFIFVDGLDRASQAVWEQFDEEEQKKQKPDHWNVWRSVGNYLRKWICGTRDLSCSVVFISHVKEKDDSEPKYRPAFVGGSVADELIGYFDYVMYQKVVPISDATVAGKAWPAVFITNRNANKGGDPRYEVGNRMPPTNAQLPGKMHADLSVVWNTLFPKKEAK
jgi:hypothetical protein